MTNVAGSAPSGSTTGVTRQPVFAGEIEVALVVRRAAEDRPGAVAHHDEVRDEDRQQPIRHRRDGGRRSPVS